MPPPITTTVASRGIRNISSPDRQQAAGSAREALARSSPLGSGWSLPIGRTTRSAKPPTLVQRAHWLSSPARHSVHSPHP